jgi:hypothetical protein
MLDLNQRPPPCKGGLLCLPLFLVVHEVPANQPNAHITRSWLFAAVRSGLVYRLVYTAREGPVLMG